MCSCGKVKRHKIFKLFMLCYSVFKCTRKHIFQACLLQPTEIYRSAKKSCLLKAEQNWKTKFIPGSVLPALASC